MKQFCFLLLFITGLAQAQFQISGVVRDGTTNKPLSFATISTNFETNVLADNDGKFSISTNKNNVAITVSYIGYHKRTVAIDIKKILQPVPYSRN